jgi:hypothetical protein
MDENRPTIEVRFGESVQKVDPRVIARYAALKLPGVDRRFLSPPEWEGKPEAEQDIGLDNV